MAGTLRGPVSLSLQRKNNRQASRARPAGTRPYCKANRLDQTRIIVPDIANACAHRPANHFVGRVGGLRRVERKSGQGRGFGTRRNCKLGEPIRKSLKRKQINGRHL
jgi:hypothetical protein